MQRNLSTAFTCIHLREFTYCKSVTMSARGSPDITFPSWKGSLNIPAGSIGMIHYIKRWGILHSRKCRDKTKHIHRKREISSSSVLNLHYNRIQSAEFFRLERNMGVPRNSLVTGQENSREIPP